MKLYYYYDKEADVLYLSEGKPAAKYQNIETSDDVILRVDPKSKAVKGLTVLNLSKRQGKSLSAIPLPVGMQFSAAI